MTSFYLAIKYEKIFKRNGVLKQGHVHGLFLVIKSTVIHKMQTKHKLVQK